MGNKTSAALLISTYNWPEALNLVFQSILRQTCLPDEIIIADDGSNEDTKKLIDSFRSRFPIPLNHFWQQDDGFRKTAIINQAIANTTCNYIIQVDGDIILDPHFIEDHMAIREKGTYVRGSRVLLSNAKSNNFLKAGSYTALSAFSNGIKNRINALRIPFLSSFFIGKSQRSDNVHGSNCAYWRTDFIKVNGYNNQMKGWGHEDIELAARFINAGLRQKKVKMLAICYHLHHLYNDRARAAMNFGIYQQAVKNRATTCSDGYLELRKESLIIRLPVQNQEAL
jgi:glycosyltransferase involved in cell wall biosynthesis